MNPTIETLLDRVQKPGRYAGGELNSVVKDRDAVRIIRVLLSGPI